MLYFCPIVWLNDPNVRFGKADDVGILAIGKDTGHQDATVGVRRHS